MANESGEERYVGRIRDVQNWVGGSDYSPRAALLVPPPDLLEDLLADLIVFANRHDLPTLLHATIAHAQFETLHPFTDGNGRVGRAMINAVLRARGTTTTVVVPIASALVARRDAYFAASEESSVTAIRIRELPDQWLTDLGRSRRGSAPRVLMESLLAHPVLSAADAEKFLGSGTTVAYTAIARLEAAGIMRPRRVGSGKRA